MLPRLSSSVREHPAEWFFGTAVALVVLAVLATLPDLVTAIRADADLVAPASMAQQTLVTPGPDGPAVTGAHPWFIGFWSVLVLLWVGLPMNVVLAIPAVLWLIMAFGIGRYWWRAHGPLAALLAVALLLSLGRQAWTLAGSWDGHSGTIFLAVAAVILLIASQRSSWGRGRRCVVLGVAGAAAGLSTGSDLLGLLLAVIPLFVGLFVAYRGSPRRDLIRLGGATGLGVVVGYGGSAVLARITDLTAAAHEITLRQDPFGGLNALYSSGSFVWSDAAIFGSAVDGKKLLLLAAFAAGWVLVLLAAAGAFSGLRRADRAAAASGDGAGGTELSVWTAYWMTALVLIACSFVFTSASGDDSGIDLALGRYLIPWWVTAAALVPLVLLMPGVWLRRIAVGAAALLICVGGGRLVGNAAQSAVRSGALTYGAGGTPSWWSDNVQRVAKRWGASHGYSGYWTSYSLGTGDEQTIPVYPLMSCGVEPAPQLCASLIASRSSMYRNSRRRSFIVLDDRPEAPPHAVSSLQGIPWRPLDIVGIAPGITMVVYDGDVGRFVQPFPGQQTVQHGN